MRSEARRNMQRNYTHTTATANIPSDTQFISSLERNDILQQSYIDANNDDNTLVHSEENDGSEDELASPRQSGGSGSLPDATDEPDLPDTMVMITSPTHISPVTPAAAAAAAAPATLAGRKRDIQGNIVSSNSPALLRTPAPNLDSFFPAAADQQSKSGMLGLGLSQLFQQTQAATSPFTNAPRSDPILERPSPDFRAPFQSSPPTVSYSSPTNNVEKTDNLSSTPAPLTALKAGNALIRDDSPAKKNQTGNGTGRLASNSQDEGPTMGSSDSDDLGMGIGKIRKGRLGASRRPFRSKRLIELKTPAKSPSSWRKDQDDRAETLATLAEVDVDKSEEELANGGRASPSSSSRQQKDVSLEDKDPEVQVPMSTSRSEREELAGYDGPDGRVYSSKRDGHGHIQKYGEDKVIQSSPQESMSMQANARSPASDISGVIQDSQGNKTQAEPPPLQVTSLRTRSRTTRASQPKASLSLSASLSSEAISSLPATANLAAAPWIGAKQKEASETRSKAPTQESGNSAVEELSSRSVDSLAPLVRAQRRRLRYSILDTSSPVASSKADISQSPPEDVTALSPQASTTSNIAPQSINEPSGVQVHSASTDLFETAPSSHLACLSPNVDPHQQSQISQSQSSPRRETVRRLVDIAGDPTPPEVNQSIDFGIDILNDDDKHFQAVTSNSHQNSAVTSRSKHRATSVLGRRALENPAYEMQKMQKSGKSHGARTPIQAQGIEEQAIKANKTTLLENLHSMPHEFSVGANAIGKLRRPSSKSNLMRNRSSPTRANNQGSFENEAGTDTTAANQEERTSSTSRLLRVSTNDTTQSSHFQPRQVEDSLPAATRSESKITSALTLDEVSNTGAANGAEKKPYPQRVFARFMDRKLAYYPATCLGRVPGRPNVFRVQFDDGTETELDVFHMRSCELRVGDLVKVDLPSMTKYTYVVKGFPQPRATVARDVVRTDVFGNESIILEARQRGSLPWTGDEGATTADAQNQAQIPITSIYFPNLLWSRLKDREYRHVDGFRSLASSSGPQTPLDGQSGAGSPPPSRARRQATASAIHTPDLLNVNPGAGSGRLFANMVFAITFTSEREAERERARISKLILENGGRILATGFEELFKSTSLATSTSTSTNGTSPSSKKSRSAGTKDETTALASDARDIGFTALIANTHCRRTKYMQALALNIPCLSGRWILDSVAHRSILPWTRYLLAAGESLLLGGAVRSRTMSSDLLGVTATTATLQEIVEGRPMLLQGKRVVIFKDKSMTEEQIKTYLFITNALGADRVERVVDVASLKALLVEPDGKWDLVYAKEKKLDEVTATAAVAAAAGAAATSSSGTARVRAVSDECIAQSLILGCLVNVIG